MATLKLNTSSILAVNRPVVIIHETNSGGTQWLTQFVREAQTHFTECFLWQGAGIDPKLTHAAAQYRKATIELVPVASLADRLAILTALSSDTLIVWDDVYAQELPDILAALQNHAALLTTHPCPAWTLPPALWPATVLYTPLHSHQSVFGREAQSPARLTKTLAI